MQHEQLLKEQGWSDENIDKLKVILSDPAAYQHAMTTGDIEAAYEMAKPKGKETLLDFFSSFSEVHHEDAKTLSAALTKFARYVQSEVDKKAP